VKSLLSTPKGEEALHPCGGNSVPVGARVVKSGGEGLYGRSLGDCVARSFPLMEVDPERYGKGKIQGLIPGESRVVLNPPGSECRSQQPLIRAI